MSHTPRIPDYCECVTVLSEQGHDYGSPSLEDDPERADRPRSDGETIAVQCGPLVGIYRVGRSSSTRPQAAARS